jgi:hypothetical protein
MSTRYRIIMYERQTDRAGGTIDVPPTLASQVLSLASITNPTEPGETVLNDQQVSAIAQLLSFRHNIGRYIYHLETVIGASDRLYA